MREAMEACEEREEMSIDDVRAAIARLSDAIKQAEALGVDAELAPWAYCGRSVATRTFMTCPKQTCNGTGRSEWAAPVLVAPVTRH